MSFIEPAILVGASADRTRRYTYWRQHGRFPDDEADPAPAVVRYLAVEIGTRADAMEGYEWTGRTGRQHRRVILGLLAEMRRGIAAVSGVRRLISGLGVVRLLHRRLGLLGGQQGRRLEAGEGARRCPRHRTCGGGCVIRKLADRNPIVFAE